MQIECRLLVCLVFIALSGCSKPSETRDVTHNLDAAYKPIADSLLRTQNQKQQSRDIAPIRVTLSTYVGPCNDFGCSDGAVSVFPLLVIQSISDNPVRIKNVVVNRGNCAFSSFTSNVPSTLRYGETANVKLFKCQVIEAKIMTSDGDFEVAF